MEDTKTYRVTIQFIMNSTPENAEQDAVDYADDIAADFNHVELVRVEEAEDEEDE